MMLKPSTLALLGLCPMTTITAQEKETDHSKPNIIFILADDMGYADLACYGNSYVKTPNIDRLAATGTRFTQCYAGSGISSPSRCALMTGKNTGHTTIRDNFCEAGGIEGLKNGNTIRRMHLQPNDTTLATVLGAAGYRTCLVNKWHLDGFNPEASPLHRGFDEFYGWLISTAYSNDPYYYPYYRFNNEELIHIEENAHDQHAKHNTDLSTEDAIKFINRSKGQPFFLYLAYDAPHEPYIIDETSWYDGQPEWTLTTKRYASLITHMDRAIGRLLDELDRLKIRKNTLIIFASDNGAAVQAPLKELNCNGTLRGRKGQLYEGGIRVPFIVNQPGKVKVQTLTNQIYFPDVMPTLAALSGGKAPQSTNGINIAPLFFGKKVETDNRLLYWEFPGKQRAARKGDWKVVTIKNGPLELYNLKNDLSESQNLASKFPEKVTAFEREMQSARIPTPNWPLATDDAPASVTDKSEHLDRGLVAIPTREGGVYLSWRWLNTDKKNTSFDLYRQNDAKQLIQLNKQPLNQTTDFCDTQVDLNQNQTWILKCEGKEVARACHKTDKPLLPYTSIPLNKPQDGITPDGETYHYTANDASVGDLDGDGEYEIILKWEPSNAKRPPQKGFSGNCLLDAYKLNGKQLWRINLGKNIRAGAAYTQFIVMDFDGDGRAEMCCKTADGTIDGTGQIIGDQTADWRRKEKQDPCFGKTVDGLEYLTMFEGTSGKALDTKPYIPTRYPLDAWGGIGGNGGNDDTGGRSDRFSACAASLGGSPYSVVMVRGWYGRTVIAAWDFKQGKLSHRWTFDSAETAWKDYSGMANHNLSVADMDKDGWDEICVGAMTVDHNGQGLYTTGLRHGDAMHLGDLIPSRPGLEVFGNHENEGKTISLMTPGLAMFDAQTGEVIWSLFPGKDIGRAMAADIDPRYEGAECWVGYGGLFDCKGNKITDKMPNSCNFSIYWDADVQAELLNKTTISKWNWQSEQTEVLFQPQGVVSNNGTKANPSLVADLWGDWREEVIFANTTQQELRIYTTTIPAVNRRPTLMHNAQYRLSVAWQNVGYNQPPHIGNTECSLSPP